MYTWAENALKLAHSKKHLKDSSLPITEESVMREYIKRGGRIVHPDSGEIVDNNTGADVDDTGQIVERHPEIVEKRIPELIEAHHLASGGKAPVKVEPVKVTPARAKKA